MPDWFREQVDRMERPFLPEFDPARATAEMGTTSFGRDRRQRSSTQDRDHPLSDVWGDG
jgi:hypothetical protein